MLSRRELRSDPNVVKHLHVAIVHAEVLPECLDALSIAQQFKVKVSEHLFFRARRVFNRSRHGLKVDQRFGIVFLGGWYFRLELQ